MQVNKEIITADQLEILLGYSKSKQKETKKIPPDIFKTPKLSVEFKNKSGNIFKSKLEK